MTSLQEILAQIPWNPEPVMSDAQRMAAQKAEDERDAQDRLVAKIKFNRGLIVKSGIPLREDDVRRLAAGGYDMTKAMDVARKWYESSSKKLASHDLIPNPSDIVEFPWLVMLGGKGVGKTFAAAWLTMQGWFTYSKFDRLCVLATAKWSADREAFEKIRDCRTLIIDEVATETDAASGRAALHELVEYRRSGDKLTLCISNLSQSAFQAQFTNGIYDMRTLDRLRECAAVRVIEGESMRADGKRGGW